MGRLSSTTKTPASGPVKLAAPLGAETPAPRDAKPAREQVQKRAYELFLARKAKNLPGSAEGDWLAAERELAGR